MLKTLKINTASDITLVTLQNCPSGLDFVAGIFRRISELGVDVDMISLAPAHGAYTSVSFTVADNDLGKILNFTTSLHDESNIKAIVSSGNCKISVYDEHMKNQPGVAAGVFSAVSRIDADIRIITTSEVDISLLVTSADFPEAVRVLQESIAQP